MMEVIIVFIGTWIVDLWVSYVDSKWLRFGVVGLIVARQGFLDDPQHQEGIFTTKIGLWD